MDISSQIESALSSVIENYYSYMPEFAEGDEPETYAVYNGRWKDINYASGKARTRQFSVSVSVFTPNTDTTLYDNVQTAMESIGAIFTGTNDLSQFDIYPNKKMLVMDFLIYAERN